MIIKPTNKDLEQPCFELIVNSEQLEALNRLRAIERLDFKNGGNGMLHKNVVTRVMGMNAFQFNTFDLKGLFYHSRDRTHIQISQLGRFVIALSEGNAYVEIPDTIKGDSSE